MDLDNLKSKWNELDVTPAISEEKIRRMVDNKGKSALSKLIRMETIFIFVSLLCILFPFLHNYIFSQAQYTPALKACYISLCLAMSFWQIFKLRYLKSLDFEKLDIIASSKKILKYRMYITYEIWGGFVFAVVFISVFVYTILDEIPDGFRIFFIVYMIFITSAMLLAAYLFYRKTYKKYIRQIQKSLAEVEDFEKE